jgi:hypothetical protein
MLCWISIFGGLLIMMGQHDRSEALFYYFRLEDQVPEHHLLRLIDKHVSFEFVRQQLKDSYSETKDASPNRWRPTRPMGMGSSYSGWPIAASLPTCGPATVFTEREVRSLDPSVSRMNRSTIAISAPPVSP